MFRKLKNRLTDGDQSDPVGTILIIATVICFLGVYLSSKYLIGLESEAAILVCTAWFFFVIGLCGIIMAVRREYRIHLFTIGGTAAIVAGILWTVIAWGFTIWIVSRLALILINTE